MLGSSKIMGNIQNLISFDLPVVKQPNIFLLGVSIRFGLSVVPINSSEFHLGLKGGRLDIHIKGATFNLNSNYMFNPPFNKNEVKFPPPKGSKLELSLKFCRTSDSPSHFTGNHNISHIASAATPCSLEGKFKFEDLDMVFIFSQAISLGELKQKEHAFRKLIYSEIASGISKKLNVAP